MSTLNCDSMDELIDHFRDLLAEHERWREGSFKQVSQQSAEIKRLRSENKTLRQLHIKRFVSCMTCGNIDEQTHTYLPQQWNWSCGICGAESKGQDATCNLVHEIDCPLRADGG